MPELWTRICLDPEDVAFTSKNRVSHFKMAYDCTTLTIFASSRLEFRTSSCRLTGNGLNKSRIKMLVPTGRAEGSVLFIVPSVPKDSFDAVSSDAVLVTISTPPESAQRAFNASPRNPSVRTVLKSSMLRSFEVVCFVQRLSKSSGFTP